MILLCGIPSEPPLAMVQGELNRLGANCVMFNQRHFAGAELEFGIEGGRVTGRFELDGSCHRLEDFHGVYTRLMDMRHLPELRGEPLNSPRHLQCQALHNALIQWMQIAPIRVVDRPAPMGSNFSKPFQAQIIREHGFRVPETLVTNEPELVHAFSKQHRRVIYKSISSIRSIVQTLGEEDMGRLDHIRWCPVQFQEFVEGLNVRVHVVGRETFATSVSSEATDYRYPDDRVETEVKAFDLPKGVAQRCVRLSQALGLGVSGIDLKITPGRQVYCFEVNPGPAFSFYEENTGQPIARAIARLLIGEQEA